MIGWVDDITKLTIGNENFRTVVYTAKHTQLTLMSLEPGEEVGWESHRHLNQFFRIERGTARVELGHTKTEVEETYAVKDDFAFIVPVGVWHNVVNTGKDRLKLYSLYSPPEHAAGTVHVTKEDAEAEEK